MSAPMLEAALRIAASGRPVFPCRGKAPLIENGLHAAATEPAQITKWFSRWPDANLAMPTGAVSGVIVLDQDGDEGADSLRDLERAYEPLPRTLTVKTPRGQHYYWRHPGTRVRNSASQLGRCLDVRGDGGYALVPPSVNAAGQPYEVDEQAPLAPMPGWLLALVRSPAEGQRTATPVSEWVGIVRDGLAEGERNHGLARLVGHLLARDVDARLVGELAHLVNGRSRPPLPDREVDKVVASIAGREVRRRLGKAA